MMAPGGALSPFRSPTFRAIWIANMFSNLGSTIQSIGAAWLMTDLTTSRQLIALVQASSTLPIMLFGVFAGAIADNFDRRQVMLVAQVGMLVVSAALSILTWAGLITPFLLLAFTLSVGVGTSLNSPAWQASVRQQVEVRDLPQAIALNSVAFNIARSIGPALGGLVISIWSVSFAFALNAVSYTVLIVVLLRWHPLKTPIDRRPILAAIGQGVRFCIHSPPLRRILSRGGVLGFGIAGYMALVPVVVRDILHGNELDFGFMLGLFGIGSIIAAPQLGFMRRLIGIENVMALGTMLFVVALVMLGSFSSMVFALIASFLAGLGWVTVLTSINVAVQIRSPDFVLGRCLSIYQAVTFGGMAMGSWGWGLVADLRTVSYSLYASAGFLLIVMIVMRILNPMPGPDEGVVDN